MIRELDDKRLGQNKVLCNFLGVKLPMLKLPLQACQRSLRHGDRFPASCRLLALELHWLGFLLVAFSLLPLFCHLFLVASSLSSHLVCFLACPVNRPRFCFAGSWIIGLAMGGAKSRGANVAFGFSESSLWKMLTIFWRCMTAVKGSQVLFWITFPCN